MLNLTSGTENINFSSCRQRGMEWRKTERRRLVGDGTRALESVRDAHRADLYTLYIFYIITICIFSFNCRSRGLDL